MRLPLAHALLCLLVLSPCYTAQKYDGCLALNAEYDIKFKWTLKGNKVDCEISSTAINGHTNIGIYDKDLPDPHFDADDPSEYIDVWSMSNGNLLDAYMDEEDGTVEGSQDLDDVVVTTEDGKMIATFSRALDTGDILDHVIPKKGKLNLMYSCHPNRQVEGNELEEHPQNPVSCVGVTQIDFSTKPSCKAGGDGGLYESPNKDFSLEYSVDGEYIDFTMSGDTDGYVSFGVAEADGKSHIDTDMYVGWVAGGEATVLDTWSTSVAKPSNDGTNDAEEVGGSEEGGKTIITFRRKLDTGDSEDVVIEDKDMLLQWAYGSSEGNGYTQHDQRGYAIVNLYSGAGGKTPFVATAGAALTITVFCVIGAYVCVRWTHKAHKFYKRSTAAKERGGGGSERAASGSASTTRYQPSGSFASSGSTVPATHRPAPTPKATPPVPRSSRPAPPPPASGPTFSEQPYDEYVEHGAPPSTNNKRGSVYFMGSTAVVGEEDYGVDDNDIGGAAPPRRPSRAGTNLSVPGDDDVYSSGSHVTSSSRYGDNDYAALDGPLDKPKQNNGTLSNYWHVFNHTRVPYTQSTIADWAVAAAYILLNIIFCFTIGADVPEVALGSLTAANMLIVALPATRNSFLVWLLGLPFDRTIMFHRWLGRWTLFLATMHMFWFWDVWISDNLGWGANMARTTVLFGIFSWMLMIFIIATSYSWVRRNKFDIFYWSHFAFLLAYLFAWLHVPQFKPYGLASVFFYLFDRAIRMFWGMYPRKTVNISCKAGGVVQVTFPKHPLARHAVGQYVFVNFPGISLLEWHPFTLSSGPRETNCEVCIKSLGDHTSTLATAAANSSDLWIRIDGPYGKLSLNHKRYEVIVMVVGGVGVTPAMALLREIYDYNLDKWESEQPPEHTKAVYFVWVTPNEDVVGWYSHVVSACADKATRPGYPALHKLIHCTRTDSVSDTSLICGRPDMANIFATVSQQEVGRRAAVYACGPEKLVNAAWDQSNKMTRAGVRFDFHHETFDF